MNIKTEINLSKKGVIILILLLLPLIAIFAQQDIPKIGVVDTSVIFTTYFTKSEGIRTIIEIQNDIEEEKTRTRNEIIELENRKLEAEQNNNTIEAIRLLNLIEEKEQYINDYIQIKSNTIALLTNEDKLHSTFYSEIADAIRYVAFKEGYTIILEKQNPIFLYYSIEIDITDEVLEYLLSQQQDE
jgi:Skp family chaperone for outer membrane proteins